MTFEPSTTIMWVRPNDLDMLGHVNNATVLEYFENARWDWMAKHGIQVGRSSVVPVVARVEVDYRRQISCRRVQVETALERVPDPDELTYQVVFHQRIVVFDDDAENSPTATEARVQVGFFDIRMGTLASVDEFFQSNEAAS